MFRKEFAILGVIFGCFIFFSMAFPNGVVESTAQGCVKCAGMPSWDSVIASAIALFVVTFGLMVTTILFHAVHVTPTAKDAIAWAVKIWTEKK